MSATAALASSCTFATPATLSRPRRAACATPAPKLLLALPHPLCRRPAPPPPRATPTSAANAAVVEPEEVTEEAYYDSDYESPMFIPECPSLLRIRRPRSELCYTYASYEEEVREREATNVMRMALETNNIFPEAHNVLVYRH